MKTKSKKAPVKTAAPKGYGKVMDPDKLLEREIEFIYEVTDEAGHQYDFFLGKITRAPLIKSRATGRYFLLPWPDILRLAVKTGLNKPAKRR